MPNTNSAELPIQAIVDLVSRTDPARLAALRLAHPASANRLQPGKMLGERDGADSSTPPPLLAALADAALGKAQAQSTALVARIRQRQRRLGRLRLASALVSALATGGFLAAALADATRTALASAATAFIATAIGLVQQYMEDYAGGANSLRERLDTALKGALSVTEAEGEWRLMTARNDFSALEPLIRNLNGTIAANRQIELALE